MSCLLYAACELLYESSHAPSPDLASGTNAVLLSVGQRFFQRLHSSPRLPNHKPACLALRLHLTTYLHFHNLPLSQHIDLFDCSPTTTFATVTKYNKQNLHQSLTPIS